MSEGAVFLHYGTQFGLLMGVAAYKAGLAWELVAQPLHYAFTTFPEDKRDENFYLCQVFYAEALANLGEPAQARRVYESLLQRPEIDAALKSQIREKLATEFK